MPLIKRIFTLAAIATVTASWAPATAGAANSIGYGSGPESSRHSGQVAAAHAAANQSAPLDRFGLIHVHTVTPTTTSAVSTNPAPEGFQFGDAAIGTGATLGLVALGAAGAITVRRRADPRPS